MRVSRNVVASLSLGLLATTFATQQAEAQTSLCPRLAPSSIAGSDDRRRPESSFDYETVSRGLDYLKNELPKAVRENASAEALLGDASYSIGYPNILIVIEGYILRQNALLQMAERDLALANSARGRASKAQVAAANQRFAEARRRFCDFLKSASYVD